MNEFCVMKSTRASIVGKIVFGTVLGVLWICVGCRSVDQPKESQDSTLLRVSEQASDLYNRGNLQRAREKYFEALRRAWAIDDAYEAGTSAYHLAACYYSVGEMNRAKDWLLDARCELIRADASCRNLWILDAKIARQEKRYRDVAYLLNRATTEEKDRTGIEVLPLPRLSNLPKMRSVAFDKSLPTFSRATLRNKRIGSVDVSVLLIQASVAVERGDFSSAQNQLTEVEKVLKITDRSDLLAEWHRISAELCSAKGQLRQAAKHFDQEVAFLKKSGLYRDLPVALEQCAMAYEKDHKFDQAADRLCRAARLYFGRSDYQLAWKATEEAGRLSALGSDSTMRVRLGLVAEQILAELPNEPLEIIEQPEIMKKLEPSI